MFQIRVWESISKSVEVNLISNVSYCTLLTHSYQLMPYCCLYFPLLGTAYYSLLSFILSIARVVPRAHSLLNPIQTSYIES